VGPQGKVSGDITDYKPHVAGAGMVVRKSAYELLKQHGFRWILSDGKNGILNTGEDLELCYALALAGYRIWYDENLGLTHYMPKSRLTQESLLELIRRNRIAGPLQAGYEIAWRGIHTSALKFYFYRVLMLGLWLAKGAVKFLLGRQTWLSLRIAFADWFQSLFDYGVLRRIFRNDLPRIQQLKEKRPICQ
jgi:GT2 family glycosyltransferase